MREKWHGPESMQAFITAVDLGSQRARPDGL